MAHPNNTSEGLRKLEKSALTKKTIFEFVFICGDLERSQEQKNKNDHISDKMTQNEKLSRRAFASVRSCKIWVRVIIVVIVIIVIVMGGKQSQILLRRLRTNTLCLLQL